MILQGKKVNVRFKEKQALDDVDFKIEKRRNLFYFRS